MPPTLNAGFEISNPTFARPARDYRIAPKPDLRVPPADIVQLCAVPRLSGGPTARRVEMRVVRNQRLAQRPSSNTQLHTNLAPLGCSWADSRETEL